MVFVQGGVEESHLEEEICAQEHDELGLQRVEIARGELEYGRELERTVEREVEGFMGVRGSIVKRLRG